MSYFAMRSTNNPMKYRNCTQSWSICCTEWCRALTQKIKLFNCWSQRSKGKYFHSVHYNRMMGHLWQGKTLNPLMFFFYWPGCRGNICRWCVACSEWLLTHLPLIKPLEGCTSGYIPLFDLQKEGLCLNSQHVVLMHFSESAPKWESLKFLTPVIICSRRVPQASTAFSPFILLYRCKPCSIVNIIRQNWENGSPPSKNDSQYVLDIYHLNFLKPWAEMLPVALTVELPEGKKQQPGAHL